MEIEIRHAVIGAFATAGFAFVGVLMKIVWDYVTGGTKANTEAVRANTKAISELQVGVVKLTCQIENLTAIIGPLPKMKEDINAAHKKIRDIEHKVPKVNA